MTTVSGFLPTRLHPPRLRPRTIDRPRLTSAWEEATAHPVTLVSGPAGAGKTTFAATCVQRDPRATAWLSIDRANCSGTRFVAYLLAAVGRVVASRTEAAQAILDATEPPDLAELLAETLVIPLSDQTAPLVLVLDDVHLVEDDPATARALAWWLDNLPTCLHVVLLGRGTPSFDLSRARAAGRIATLDHTQLRFTSDESRRFYRDVMGMDLSEAKAADLEAKTEGWPAGAQLCALSLRSPSATLPDDRNPEFLAEYLATEVLGGLDPSLRQFRLAIAILDRFCAPLAAALTGDPAASSRLREVEQANLFVVPLDGHDRWFRFHHMFGEFLRRELERLGVDHVQRLHQRAADWLAARDLRDDAIEHWVAAGSYEALGTAFEHWAPASLLANRRGEVRRWLAKIPLAWHPLRPLFAFVDGWCDVVEGRLDQGITKIDGCRADLDPTRTSPATAMLVGGMGPILRIAACVRRGQYAEAIDATTAALAAMPPPPADPMSGARAILGHASFLMQRGLAHLELGRPDAASDLAAVVDATSSCLDAASPSMSEGITTVMATLLVLAAAACARSHRERGEWDLAADWAHRASTWSETHAVSELSPGGMARVEVGWVMLHRGRPERAQELIEGALERLSLLRDADYVSHASLLQIEVLTHRGELEDALAAVDHALDLVEATDLQPAARRLRAVRTALLAQRSPAPTRATPPTSLSPLTERERDVLALLSQGFANKEIAAKLFVTTGTVKTHVHRILRKLDVPNRTRAVHLARSEGWI